MSDTPATDREVEMGRCVRTTPAMGLYVGQAFAAGMERALAAANARVKALERLLGCPPDCREDDHPGCGICMTPTDAIPTLPLRTPYAELLLDAMNDAVSALQYIESAHGRLYGVGFDRVYAKHAAALANAPAPSAGVVAGDWTVAELRELQEKLLSCHVSALLAGEKMKPKDASEAREFIYYTTIEADQLVQEVIKFRESLGAATVGSNAHSAASDGASAMRQPPTSTPRCSCPPHSCQPDPVNDAGTFCKVSRGLVRNAPASEATIVGVALGEAGWVRSIERLPTQEGKYLCAVFLKARYHNSECTRHPRKLYRVLRFDLKEGGFWLDNGMPGPGIVTHWTTVPKLPKDEMGPFPRDPDQPNWMCACVVRYCGAAGNGEAPEACPDCGGPVLVAAHEAGDRELLF